LLEEPFVRPLADLVKRTPADRHAGLQR